MKLLLPLLLLAAPSMAADYKYLGSLNASSGASTNNNSSANTNAAGSTAAIGAITASAQRPVRIAIQCDVAVRLHTGTSSSVAAANSGANKGPKLDVDQFFFLDLTVSYLAIIPASGSGSAVCDLYQRIGE